MMSRKVAMSPISIILFVVFIGICSAEPGSNLIESADNPPGDISQATLTQDVDIVLTPHQPPIVIQPSGGNFDYTIDVTNNEDEQLSFQVWTILVLPDNRQVRPVYGPVAFMLPPGWSANRDLSQEIPGNAPPGNYGYIAHIGIFPRTIWASDGFSLQKRLTSAGWYPQTSGTSAYLSSVHFVNADTGWAVGATNTILRTTDGGDNWYTLNPPPSSNYYDVHFADAQTGWAVGSSGKIVKSIDGGTTWENQTSGTSYGLYGVHFIDENSGWVVGGKSRDFTPPTRFILHTIDGGATWYDQFNQFDRDPLKAIYFVDALTGWAVGSAGSVLRTTDGGETWVERDSGTIGELQSVHFVNSLDGWVVGVTGTVLRTTDGGDTWHAQDSGTSASLGDVFFIDTQNGWVVGGDGSGGVILRTTDGGNTWQAQVSGTIHFLSSVFFTDLNTGWTVGNIGTILHTITGGE